MKKSVVVIFLFLSILFEIKAEDGYRLWIRYDLISDQKKLTLHHELTKGWVIEGESPTLAIARKELQFPFALGIRPKW